MSPNHTCKVNGSPKVHLSSAFGGTLCGYSPTRTRKGTACKVEKINQPVDCEGCKQAFEWDYKTINFLNTLNCPIEIKIMPKECQEMKNDRRKAI